MGQHKEIPQHEPPTPPEVERYYAILDLEPDASPHMVKQAYQDLTIVWQPDRFADHPRLQQKAREKLKAINEAYEGLKSLQYSSHLVNRFLRSFPKRSGSRTPESSATMNSSPSRASWQPDSNRSERSLARPISYFALSSSDTPAPGRSFALGFIVVMALAAFLLIFTQTGLSPKKVVRKAQKKLFAMSPLEPPTQETVDMTTLLKTMAPVSQHTSEYEPESSLPLEPQLHGQPVPSETKQAEEARARSEPKRQ